MKNKKAMPIFMLGSKVGVAMVDVLIADILEYNKLNLILECDNNHMHIEVEKNGKKIQIGDKRRKNK